MYLRYHMGGCCGIKTIYGFWGNPLMNITAKAAEVRPDWCRDRQKSGLPVEMHDSFYWPEAPEETREQRLQRYIDFCKEQQGSGLIEVSLVSIQWPKWESVLIEKGFKVAAEFVNGNSGKQIRVYHFVYGKAD